MKQSTKRRKQTASDIQKVFGEERLARQLLTITNFGKQAFDSLHHELGRMLVESIFILERESITGPDHAPGVPGVYKWGHQGGSVYVGDQKVRCDKPRIIGPDGEIPLPTYEKLKERGQFSDELLARLMTGMSARRYEDVVVEAANAFGVSPSSVSRHFVEASAKKLKEFSERRLEDFKPFAIMLDTVHRGGVAFIVALGIDILGKKKVLGFWEGATENGEITIELLAKLEERGLELTSRCLFITDGGKGIIAALKAKFGKKLMHQRCVIHKGRNIQRHLAKKYRKRAQELFTMALEHTKHEDALRALTELEKWLRGINPSAANSLLEAFDEILLLHRLEVPEDLRPTLRSTNGIENLFSTVRQREKNVKNYNSSYRGKPSKKGMSQRWLGTVLLNAESNFRAVNGAEHIPTVLATITRLQTDFIDNKNSVDNKKTKAA
jgi:putative transposase